MTAGVWGIFMLGGAGASMVGVLIPRGVEGHWFGEFVGLPALASMVVLYGAAVIAHAIEHGNGRAPVGVLLFALALGLAIRWMWARSDARKSCPPTPDDG